MDKYSFKNDYGEGAHQNIIDALSKTNFNQEEGYGEDSYCRKAAELIRKKIKNQNADIHFVSAGTQANLIVISSILKPYESVISVDIGHISIHEAGAIEATGHKVNAVEAANGKLSPENIRPVIDFHENEHMVKPRVVFISNSTEIGTVYSKKELEKLSAFCRRNKLFLYLDGARLGSALTANENDLTLSELSELVDAFYIGGTKNGALLGEAIVLNNAKLQKHFRFNLKQKGALLAKGRIIGIQFLELFKNDLFFKLGEHANLMASKLSRGIAESDYEFLIKPVSNQIFPILPNKLIEKLSKKYKFYIWKKIDNNNSAIRLVTSWATKEEYVYKFILDMK